MKSNPCQEQFNKEKAWRLSEVITWMEDPTGFVHGGVK
jgi:hypothetical protein